MAGCVTNSSPIAQFYKPYTPYKQKKGDPSVVQIREVPFNTGKKWFDSMNDEGYFLLGWADFSGPLLTPEALKQFAASVGGDMVVYEKLFIKNEQGSRMVVASYTPPSTGYANTSGSGFTSGSSYTTAQTPWGPASANSYGSVNSFNSSSTTVYNPGQTTYARQDFTYQAFNQGVIVWQSPAALTKNWDNIDNYLEKSGENFDFDDFLSTYKSKYNSLSPNRKALADAINSGQKFTSTTAKQFMFKRHLIQLQRDYIKKMP